MANGYAAPVITGLALGVGFIVLFAFLGSNILPLYSESSSNNTLQDSFEAAERMTTELDEVRAFLSVYPNANSTVYFVQICSDDSCSSFSRIPGVVEYWYREGSGRYADLRITLHHESMEPTSMQIRCIIIHKETNTVLNPETDLVERHGKRLEDTGIFLQNELCPM